MDKAASAPEHAENPSAATVPTGWAEVQESLAAASGLALLLVEGRQPPALRVSHNNSICQAFQSSPKHAHLCDPFCGRAFERAQEAAGPAHYRCHAGLHCFAAPLDLGAAERLAVIAGRAFLRSSDYRVLAERMRSGDLSDLLSPDLFRNVIFALEQDLADLAVRLREAAEEFPKGARGSRKSAATGRGVGAPAAGKADAGVGKREAPEAEKSNGVDEASEARGARRGAAPAPAAMPHANGSAPSSQARGFASNTSLAEACEKAVRKLCESHGVESVALMLRADEKFTSVYTTGQFRAQPPRVSLKAKEIKLLQAATHGESIAVPAGGRTATRHEDAVELFPLAVGEEMKGALLVGDKHLSEEQRRAVAAFCREIALPLEVLRLREELERRMRTATHLRAFVERINSAPPEEAYQMILRQSAEMLRAERGSLLLYDEAADELSMKAMVGPRTEAAQDVRLRMGEGVAGTVMREGRPLVVSDVALAGWKPAPAERSYKTKSFISYPLSISGRKVGVLNVTDKAGGGNYDDVDLSLLDLIAPQMALALDRAQWHQKATQFQLLSITDPLTGLLNRRYLEERLSEELERSKRHQFQMSFMMVDIDDFKHYNDLNGHQAGDLALEMTAQCLKATLRSADVAARYGGEEFCVLLPQTSLSEAVVIGERIRRRIERTQFPHDKAQPAGNVTVSIGISAFGSGVDTPASVIYAADQALYVAKSRGKNCVNAYRSEAEKNSKDADAEDK
ncbi:MAG TPA: diguanylate cyclase [Pyrinomonadaceae bacterium]